MRLFAGYLRILSFILVITIIFAQETPNPSPEYTKEQNGEEMQQNTEMDIISDEKKDDPSYPEFKIVGGSEAKPHSAPYIVSFLIRDRFRWVPFCAGSLLTDSWILTAAHCLTMDPRRVTVVAGHHNINQLTAPVQMRRADLAVKHKGFKGIGPDDIGLLHVSQAFKFDSNVKPVKLARSVNLKEKATLFGWGSMSNTTSRKFPTNLQTVNLAVVSNDYCRKMYPVRIPDSNVCAGEIGKGGCVGDSGGPLMQNGTQIGVVSFGPGSCNPREGPTVFARVTSYIDWIEKRLTNPSKRQHDDTKVEIVRVDKGGCDSCGCDCGGKGKGGMKGDKGGMKGGKGGMKGKGDDCDCGGCDCGGCGGGCEGKGGKKGGKGKGDCGCSSGCEWEYPQCGWGCGGCGCGC